MNKGKGTKKQNNNKNSHDIFIKNQCQIKM
jgi:hypothetical protein